MPSLKELSVEVLEEAFETGKVENILLHAIQVRVLICVVMCVLICVLMCVLVCAFETDKVEKILLHAIQARSAPGIQHIPVCL